MIIAEAKGLRKYNFHRSFCWEATGLDILPEWEQIDLHGLHGTVLIIGAPDVGKSTFARYLFDRLSRANRVVAYLDGDPGQSQLGLPATMTIRLNDAGQTGFPPVGKFWQRFVGSVSPRGHMLPVVVGGWKLVQAARSAGAELVIYDSSGLIDPAQGGLALKLAKYELLQPDLLVAIQRDKELEPILRLLRRNPRSRVIELNPSDAVHWRDTSMRQKHRADLFAEYFSNAITLPVQWEHLVINPGPRFTKHQLVAFEDDAGFLRGLGIVLWVDRRSGQVDLFTPLTSLNGINALHLGDLEVDPHTFRDAYLSYAE